MGSVKIHLDAILLLIYTQFRHPKKKAVPA